MRQGRPRQVLPPQKAEAGPAGSGGGAMRIAKAIARAGICSRRDAERMIEEGRVSVDGRVLRSPALNVTGRETILIDGKPLPAAEGVRLWRYHKPKGRVTTHKDPEGRPTVFEALPADMPRVISIGRLDYNSEGLLLLTNDGALARHLELPATGWLRRYRARAWGKVTVEQLEALAEGVTVDGVHYEPIEARLDREQGDNVWLTLALREGKNREVRKVLGSLGLEVNRLIRISYGPFQLTDLAPGAIAEIDRRVLRDQMGPAMAETFGLAGRAPEPKKPAARGRAGSKTRPNTDKLTRRS
jgi:23S rRNA pseudouridine2605 synthase